MTTVAILPVPSNGEPAFIALTSELHSIGKTPGQALDSLTEQLPANQVGTLVIVQRHQPDHFFNAEQQARLQSLMQSWRQDRDQGCMKTAEESAELQSLIEAELRAATERANLQVAGNCP